MAKKFDSAKPHGLVSGCPKGRRYVQGEDYFHGDGTLWVDPDVAPEPKLPAEPEEPKPKTPVAARRELLG